MPGRVGLSVPVPAGWRRLVPPRPGARAAPSGPRRVAVMAVAERMPATVGERAVGAAAGWGVGAVSMPTGPVSAPAASIGASALEVAPREGVPPEGELGERGVLTVDDFFAPVPEWVLDAAVSDCAVRLFAVLLRYGQTSGARMPSRATLAKRLRKGSTDTVDRAMRELVALGAVTVERRRAEGVSQTNR